MRRALFVLSLIVLSACNATVGVSGTVQVPRDAANTCARHCASLGLQLSAVAIMADNVGCVCQPRSGTPGAVALNYSAGTAAGMAAIAMEQAAQNQRTQQQAAQQK